MAKVREYNNQQNFSGEAFGNVARTQDITGYESGQAISRGFQGVAGGIKQAEEHIASSETSKAAADLATLHAQLTTQWNDTIKNADPNDHELAQRFRDKVVKPAIDKIGSGLLTQQGQEFFQRSSANINADFFTKTAADQARLAGEGALTNVDTVKNQLSNAARGDPTSLTHQLFSSDAAIDASTAIPVEERLKLKRSNRAEIAKSAAYGAADLNPQAAKDALERGDYNDVLDGTTVKTLSNYADQKIKAQEAEKRVAEAEQRRVDDQAAEDQANTIANMRRDPQTGEERLAPGYFQAITKYRQMPGAKVGTGDALEAAGNRILSRTYPIVSDPDTKANFLTRIWLSPDDPNKLSLADVDASFGAGQLNKADHTMMRQAIQDADKDPNKAQNMRSLKQKEASFKAFITHSTLLSSDKDGDIRYGDLVEEKDRQFQEGLRNGLSAKDMLDPTSSKYIFNDVQRYVPPADMERFRQNIQGTAPPIGPPSVIPWAAAPAHSGTPGSSPGTLPSAPLMQKLNLSPEEQHLYQHHVNNLLHGGAVKNADGSTSTIRNITVGFNGKTYVIPTVWDGKILSNDEAIARAKQEGLDKWPSYATEAEAEKRYTHEMHDAMEKDITSGGVRSTLPQRKSGESMEDFLKRTK